MPTANTSPVRLPRKPFQAAIQKLKKLKVQIAQRSQAGIRAAQQAMRHRSTGVGAASRNVGLVQLGTRKLNSPTGQSAPAECRFPINQVAMRNAPAANLNPDAAGRRWFPKNSSYPRPLDVLHTVSTTSLTPLRPQQPRQYVLGLGEAATDRLAVSEEAYGEATSALVRQLCSQVPRVWPQPPLSMAVVACGAGSQLASLAELAGPGAQFHCSDISEQQIAVAQRTASDRGLVDIRFEVLDIEQQHTSRLFDVVHARFILVHLQKPAQALSNMWAMVGDGGLLLSEEHAISGIGSEPAAAVCERAKNWLSQLGQQRGVDFNLGSKLPALFQQADVPLTGWRQERVGYSSGRAKRLLEMSLREGAQNYVDAGIVSEPELNATCDELRSLASRPDTRFFVGHFSQAWAQRQKAA